MNAVCVSHNLVNSPQHFLTIISFPTSILEKSPTINATISSHEGVSHTLGSSCQP